MNCLRWIFLVAVANFFHNVGCFIPAELFTFVIEQAGSHQVIDYGEASDTMVHEEILRYGIISSVAKFLIDHPANNSRVTLANITLYQNDIRYLYYDYYGLWICRSKLDILLKTILQPNVAIVDVDPKTKDLPYAHFDAETFINSNQRVMNFTTKIYNALSNKDYFTAQINAGQIMHTIQDFYSHSNWVEAGNTQINTNIGTAAFANSAVATRADNVTCTTNCTLVNVTCSSFLSAINFHLFSIKCPMPYFICKGNLVVLDKLVSGYYSDQKLDDGTPVEKPEPSGKCSHGGILDGDQYKSAAGGINKDSGYYLFSPHADLHLTAANLAIKHTEYFFNQIRTNIGDDEFKNFLSIYASDKELTAAQNVTQQMCSAFVIMPPSLFMVFILQLLLFYLIL